MPKAAQFTISVNAESRLAATLHRNWLWGTSFDFAYAASLTWHPEFRRLAIATYLGQQDRIGTLAPGKQADLVLVKGDPSKNIEDIEKRRDGFQR